MEPSDFHTNKQIICKSYPRPHALMIFVQPCSFNRNTIGKFIQFLQLLAMIGRWILHGQNQYVFEYQPLGINNRITSFIGFPGSSASSGSLVQSSMVSFYILVFITFNVYFQIMILQVSLQLDFLTGRTHTLKLATISLSVSMKMLARVDILCHRLIYQLHCPARLHSLLPQCLLIAAAAAARILLIKTPQVKDFVRKG